MTLNITRTDTFEADIKQGEYMTLSDMAEFVKIAREDGWLPETPVIAKIASGAQFRVTGAKLSNQYREPAEGGEKDDTLAPI